MVAEKTRAIEKALACAERHSPFLRGLGAEWPELAPTLAREGLPRLLHAVRGASIGERDQGRALRRERQQVALAVALADLAGAPLEETMAALSAFADDALDRAIAIAIRRRAPDAEPAGLVALALGKLGSRELNYSSDVDPILLFDPDSLPRRVRDDPADAAVRIARDVVELLQERTRDGYVLRVDLRLRPAAEATPLAVSLGRAIVHYESSALPWERAAFVRARSAAGDVALGRSFLATIRPFIWRRALDYGVIADMRALSRRIRDNQPANLQLGPGFDLKRGRGGIREIEFFAQIHQLIHGGRDPSVRVPATLDALAALRLAGIVPAEAADAMAQAYRLLRTVEHRLQMVDDRQTHRLPADPAELDNVARLHGAEDGAALLALLRPHVERAASLYDELERFLPEPGGGGRSTPPDLSRFADPPKAGAMIARWREGSARATRAQPATVALEAALPRLIEAFARAPLPDAALGRLDALVWSLPTAINLFRLLEARPGLGEQLAAILSHAPALALQLTRSAQLLDGLIDRRAFEPPPDVSTLAAEFARGERGEDYQALLDRVRLEVGERRFQLGVQLVNAAADPIAVGEGYARVAEAALAVLAAATVREFERAHGRVPGGELVVVALGRLGGGLLTHASDLDLVFLFTGDFLDESDGARPLSATLYFNRLAQRVVAALSVPTAQGPLYPVDTRLRPSGTQGLLAVSVESFARYQAEGAWTWEHMALMRARAVFGSAEARDAVSRVVQATLRRPRDRARLNADAAGMRGDIARNKPPAGPLDVKLVPGGLVDAEFAVHLLQLATGVGLDARLRDAAQALERANLLAPGSDRAGTLLTRMLILLRLVAPDGGEPEAATRPLVAASCGAADWDELMERYADARRSIASEWRRVAGLD